MNSAVPPLEHRLRLLGGLSLERGGAPVKGTAAQRHKLALLALLARAPGFTMTRDKLVALLWPESDDEHGRGLLNAATYALRKALGPDALVSSRDSVRLDADRVSIDALEMDRLAAAGDLEAAAAAYGGPFLDGFHLPGSATFDAWMETERTNLAARYRNILEDLAEVADLSAALEYRRRLVAETPYSPVAALRYMGALEAAGEWPRALSFASAYEELVRTDLGVRPDTRILALAEAIRKRHGRLAGESSAGAPPAPDHRVDFRDALSGGAGRAEGARSRAPALAGAAVVVVGLLAIFAPWQRLLGTSDAANADRIAVLPFAVQAAPDLAYLSEGIMDLLAAKLNGMGAVASVDPPAIVAAVSGDSVRVPDPERARALAAQFGAGFYVRGTVVDLAGTLEIRGALHRQDGSLVGEAVARGAPGELPRTVDHLARLLLAEHLGQAGRDFERLAATTTDSLRALRAYLEGEQLYRQGRYPEASRRFEEATTVDTAFALAWYRLGRARDLSGADTPWWENAAEARAAALAEQLPFVEQELIRGALLRAPEAVPVFAELTRVVPENAEAHFQLGRALIRSSLGGEDRDRDAVSALERAVSLDPSHEAARGALAFALARRGDWDRLGALVRAPNAAHTPGLDLGARAYLAFARGGAGEVDALLAELDSVRGEKVVQLGAELTVLLPDGRAAARVYQALTTGHRPPELRGYGYRRLADLALVQGRWESAAEYLRDADRAYGQPDVPGEARLGILPYSPLNSDQLRDLRRRLQLDFREGVHIEGRAGGLPALAVSVGLLSARLEDADGIRDAIAMLGSIRETPNAQRVPFLQLSLEAELAWVEGRAHDAVATLGRLVEPNANQRHLMARALEAVGREDEAIGWYASYPDLSQNAAAQLGWRPSSLLRTARILERSGDVDGARGHYEALLDLWKDADASVQHVVDEARAELEALGG